MKKIWILTLCLVLAWAPGLWAGKTRVKLAHISSTNSVTHAISMAFKSEIETRLPGFEVEIYPAGQLGGTVALRQALQLNMVHIYPEFPFIWEGVVPEFKVWAVHYKFKDRDECMAFAQSPLHGQMIEKLVARAGVRLIGHADAGTFSFLANRPVHTMADLKGMKNRVAQMAPLMECWRAYGASPTPLDWGEVYTGLATGVIQGLDNPTADMVAEKFHEVSSYLNRTRNLYNVFSFNTSEAFWKGLSDEEKQVFQAAVRAADQAGRQWVESRKSAMEQAMKDQGVTFIDTDLTGFAQAVRDNIDTILDGNRGAVRIYEKIMARDYSRLD